MAFHVSSEPLQRNDSLEVLHLCDFHQYVIIILFEWRSIDIPSESVSHATAGGHDGGRGKQQTNEREPWEKISADS